MIRTMIIDDEALAIRRLEIKLGRYRDIDIVGHCRDGDTALAEIRRKKPDLVLLDINMPGLDGLAVAEDVASTGTHIIFVTAFHQYAVQAFERNAVDYLLKPVSTDRLDLAIERFRSRRQQRDAMDQVDELRSVIAQLRAANPDDQDAVTPQYFWTKDNGVSQKICLNDIEWIEAARDYVSLHMKNGRMHFVRHTMNSFEKRLDPKLFQRVHRSAIVNLSLITKISHKDGIFRLIMRSNANIRVGRAYKTQTDFRLKELSSSARPGA